jgi:hypothetical protein
MSVDFTMTLKMTRIFFIRDFEKFISIFIHPSQGPPEINFFAI